MAYPRSALSVNPIPHKTSIGKVNEIMRRRSGIQNLKLKSLFEIPEDLLNRWTMRSAWESLKASTQAHGELDVRPYRCEVQ
jgi:hypothetical protein